MLAKPDACKSCPAYHIGEGFVPPEGPSDAPFQVLGEAPGKEEADAGRPFVGASGTMMRVGLKIGGVTGLTCGGCKGAGYNKPRNTEVQTKCEKCAGSGRDYTKSVRIGNTICCRPPNNDYTKIPREAITYCMSTYWGEPPEGARVLLVGGRAMQAVFPHCGSIEKWRGSLLEK